VTPTSSEPAPAGIARQDAPAHHHFDLEWPVPLREAYRAWQPAEPSPIVRKLIEARRGSNA